MKMLQENEYFSRSDYIFSKLGGSLLLFMKSASQFAVPE
jgi:hypothetical protein